MEIDWKQTIITETIDKEYSLNSLVELLEDIQDRHAVELIIEYLCRNEVAFNEVRDWIDLT